MIAAAERWRAPRPGRAVAPCTQMREHPQALPLFPVARGEGAWLVGHDGRRCWTASAVGGPTCTATPEPPSPAIARGAGTLGRSSGRLLAPARGGAGRAPAGRAPAQGGPALAIGVLRRQRFVRRGSRAEDGVPLVPQPRRDPAYPLRRAHRQLPRRNLGALSVGDIPLYPGSTPLAAAGRAVRTVAGCVRGRMTPPMPGAARWPRPDALQQTCSTAHPGEICALVLEPLVQCAGGMRMHHPVYLRRVPRCATPRRAADRRRGSRSASAAPAACSPAQPQRRHPADLLCLSKA